MIKKYCSPYSNKIRDKAINLVKKKKKIKDIASHLKISTRTIIRWKKLEKNGQRYAKSGYKRGRRPFFNEKILSLILKSNVNQKQKEAAASYFHLTGNTISQSSISKYFKKIRNSKRIQ
jgi:transposase